jgi:hypothetical protein
MCFSYFFFVSPRNFCKWGPAALLAEFKHRASRSPSVLVSAPSSEIAIGASIGQTVMRLKSKFVTVLEAVTSPSVMM